MGSSTPASEAPPNDPWIPLQRADPPSGYLSVYLSDDLATRYPVRDVTRIADNKSDPNLETRSYGLFSTCEERMRAGVVKRGIRYVFFLTSHRRAPRAVTGYYDIRWYTKGALSDDALAAERVRFVAPIPVADVEGSLGHELQRRFRMCLLLNAKHTGELRDLIDASSDLTDRYVEEIDRLERLAMRYTGYRYPSWRRTAPFSWTDARGWLPAEDDQILDVPNSSPTGQWTCVACHDAIRSVARLKMCPNCGRRGTLRPAL
jgi:hypothetical protein